MRARTVLAVALGTLAAATLLVLLAGASPADAFAALLRGAFGSKAAVGETAARSTGLVLTAVAAVVAFRAGVLNIGLEGQFLAGAAAAAAVGPLFPDLPFAARAAVVLAAPLAGALQAAPAAWLAEKTTGPARPLDDPPQPRRGRGRDVARPGPAARSGGRLPPEPRPLGRRPPLASRPRRARHAPRSSSRSASPPSRRSSSPARPSASRSERWARRRAPPARRGCPTSAFGPAPFSPPGRSQASPEDSRSSLSPGGSTTRSRRASATPGSRRRSWAG